MLDRCLLIEQYITRALKRMNQATEPAEKNYWHQVQLALEKER